MPRNNKILIRSGTVAPTASDFAVGEPAFDKSAGKLYIKNAAGTMVELGAGGGSGSVDVYEFATPASFPATGSSAVIYIATDSGRLYRWVGTAYMELGPIGSDVDSLLRSLLVPPAPTSVSASAGNAQATVSWTAPSGVISQAPITDYVVQYSSNSGSTWTTFTRTASTATSATVTGLTNGTAYQFRVAAVNAIGTGAYSTASSAVTPVAGDPQWANVQLLLPGDTSVNDASSYNRSVSAVGGAAVSTAQKRWGAGSIAFDGTAGYITAAIPAFGSSDFVVEMWIWFNSISGSYTGLFDPRPSVNGAYPSILMNGSALSLYVGNSFVISGATPPTGQWNHIALARSSGSTRLYLNGSQTGSTYADTNTYLAASATLIGQGAGGSFLLNGYIDDLRITVGSARGMTGATIPVPTAAFPTVGPGGVPTDGYFSNVVALLHMDGTGATFTDSSAAPKTITAVGNATQVSSQSKFGGKSLYCDGNGDYVSVPSVTLSGDFVFEGWLRWNGGVVKDYSAIAIGGANSQFFLTTKQNRTGLRFGLTGVAEYATGSFTWVADTWYHVALSRSGSAIRLFVNGTNVTDGSPTNSTAFSGELRLGGDGATTYDSNIFLDDVRITAGSARGYTGATIPVPTAAFPDA